MYLVDSFVEFPAADIPQGLRHNFFQFGEDQADKGLGPADPVLIETGYRLMLPHGLFTGNEMVPMGAGLVLVKESMAAFMDHAVHAGHEIFGIIVGSDPDVIPAGGIGKGMFRRGQQTSFKIVAYDLQQVTRSRLLALFIHPAASEIRPDLLFGGQDLSEQGDQTLTAGVKDDIQLSAGHTSFVNIQQIIIDNGRRMLQQGLFLQIRFPYRFQGRNIERKIRLVLCLDPVHISFVIDFGKFQRLFGADIFGLLHFSEKTFRQDTVCILQILPVLIECPDLIFEFRGMAQRKGLILDKRDQIALFLHRFGGTDGFHIKSQQ